MEYLNNNIKYVDQFDSKLYPIITEYTFISSHTYETCANSLNKSQCI